MRQWEYSETDLYDDDEFEGIVHQLNELGSQGWEVIQLDSFIRNNRKYKRAFLKREIVYRYPLFPLPG